MHIEACDLIRIRCPVESLWRGQQPVATLPLVDPWLARWLASVLRARQVASVEQPDFAVGCCFDCSLTRQKLFSLVRHKRIVCEYRRAGCNAQHKPCNGKASQSLHGRQSMANSGHWANLEIASCVPNAFLADPRQSLCLESKGVIGTAMLLHEAFVQQFLCARVEKKLRFHLHLVSVGVEFRG